MPEFPKAQTVFRPEFRRWDVYVQLGSTAEGRMMYDQLDGPPILVAPMTEAPIYMSVPADVGQAIADALNNRPAATERHLDDAIAVRDRLLDLVDRAVPFVELPNAS